jgi:putative permease
MTKQLVKYGLTVLATLLALVILWQFRVVVVYVLLSLTVAATLRPLVRRLAGKNLVVRILWILLYLIILGVFGFLLFLTIKTAINEIQELIHVLAVQNVWMLPVWLEGSSFFQTLIARLPPPNMFVEAVTGDHGQLVLPALLGFTESIASVVTGVVVILLLTIYWIINQIHFERLWLSLLPSGQRKQARGIWRTIEPDLGAYIRSQVILSLLAGVVLGLGYWVIGSPYPMLLALTSALACLIPVVGTTLAMVPPLLVGLLTGVQLSLITVLFTAIVVIAIAIWVKPRLFNARWDNPILTLILIILLAYAFGFVGIIVAPPISAICQILWHVLVKHRHVSGAAANISDLKDRQERIWDTIRALDEPPPVLVTSSMERLTQLIEKAEPMLQTGQSIIDQTAETSGALHLPEPVTAEDGQPGTNKSRRKKR